MPLVGQGSPRWSSADLFSSADGNRGCRLAAIDRAPEAGPSWALSAPYPPPSCDACPGRPDAVGRGRERRGTGPHLPLPARRCYVARAGHTGSW